ncbi:hypothetical protein EJV47_23890 [Hymenobacter gummosus]|uniref:Uncharacterized protein n=1 Tax=Hymenobacter gummosus TaxID=1776032 RepID=A0A431TW25_9BACT|nr:hypothetical protein [Hymenobacter gummosus]RTQ45875.1 hypothetical protein EJV47_23890 [Hymenobacter gummosus]
MRQLWYLALLPLLAVQCRKEEEAAVTPLPAGLQAYAYFLPGTYWIYRDSASGQLDSVWVTSARTWVHSTKDRNRVYGRNEELEVQMASSSSTAKITYTSQRTCIGIPDSSTFSGSDNDIVPCWLIHQHRANDFATASAVVFAYALRVGQPELNGAAYRYRLPQRLSGGRTFEQVVSVTTRDGDLATRAGFLTRYWWAKGLGVVQQRQYRSIGVQTWTLVREHILQ